MAALALAQASLVLGGRHLLRSSGLFSRIQDGRSAAQRLLGVPSVQRRLFSDTKILVEFDENRGIAVMKMKSPPVNSLSLDFLTEFSINLEKLENDKGCRGVILTSATPHIFSAGLDIMEMVGKSEAHYTEFWRAVQEMWLTLYNSSMVTIAAINGSSPAGGCLMALSCDYRIMAENPKYSIGLNETQLGIVAPFWFKDTILNTIGHRAAERSLQLGLLFSPTEALKVGIVDELVPEEKVQSRAAEVMSQWLAIPVCLGLRGSRGDGKCPWIYHPCPENLGRGSCPPAYQILPAEADAGPPGGSPGRRHPEFCPVHFQGLHPEVPPDLH